MMTPTTPVDQLHVGLVRENEAAAWDRFVAGHSDGHLLQSWEWGRFKSAYGWIPARLAVRDSAGVIQAGASVLFRRPARLVPVSVAYVPRGPMMRYDGTHPATVALLAGLHRLCRERGAVLLKVEPNGEANPQTESLLAAWGFRAARRAQPLRSIWLDLRPGEPEETLLAAMKPKTRYNIRLSARRGVTVRHASGPADLQAFHNLMAVTGERDKFPIDNLAFYSDALGQFADPGFSPEQRALAHAGRAVATLLLAYHPDYVRPLAALMAFAAGPEAISMYAASSGAGREYMPAYRLQWEAMRWARRLGCERYDFWGIPPDPRAQAPAKGVNPNVRQGLWGVYRFKQGFGGREVTYLGAWDFVYRPLLYRLYQQFLTRRYPG